MVTGSADMISGRVADPAGDRVDAIHVYRDLNGNGVLDPDSDELLHADTTPADGYAFDAGSLPSGRHVLHVAAIKDGAVAGSSTSTLVAAQWWSVSISSRIHGEAWFPTTGEVVADPAPIELAAGPDGGNWQDAVRRRVTGTVYTANLITQETHAYTFPEPGSDSTLPSAGGAFAIGTARELIAAFGPGHGIPVAAAAHPFLIPRPLVDAPPVACAPPRPRAIWCRRGSRLAHPSRASGTGLMSPRSLGSVVSFVRSLRQSRGTAFERRQPPALRRRTLAPRHPPRRRVARGVRHDRSRQKLRDALCPGESDPAGPGGGCADR